MSDRSKIVNTSAGGFSAFMQKYSVIFAWLVVVIIFTAVSGDLFFNFNTLSLITGTRSVVAILAIAIMIPLTAGDYDMSAAYMMSLSNMITVFLTTEMGCSLWISILVALGVGAIVGFINGIFVVKIGIDPFIVTMGVGTLLSGVTLWISNKTLSGQALSVLQDICIGKLFGIQYIFFYCLVLMIILWYLFENTSIGKKILFIGHGKDVARLSGVKVSKIRWGCLIASSVVAAFAGVLYSGVTGSAKSGSCNDFLMPAFAAIYLGTTFIKPGRFNPVGTFISVFFLETGIRGLSLLGASTYIQNIFYGAALVLAVAVSVIIKKNNIKKDKAKKMQELLNNQNEKVNSEKSTS